MQALTVSLRKENTRVREREKVITELARRDQLTGLFNRRDAEKRFMLMMEEAHREGCQLAVFFLDLDNFKPMNDSLGHAAGDQLLQELSRRLEESRAPRELLYRFGGDEFLLIRTKMPRDQEQWEGVLEGRARQILAAISEPVQIGQNTIMSTVSVGIAIAPLAASLNFRVVAEGVETLECLERLRRLGCHEGQGYYWSPAMPLEAWLDYLAASWTQVAPE